LYDFNGQTDGHSIENRSALVASFVHTNPAPFRRSLPIYAKAVPQMYIQKNISMFGIIFNPLPANDAYDVDS